MSLKEIFYSNCGMSIVNETGARDAKRRKVGGVTAPRSDDDDNLPPKYREDTHTNSPTRV